MWRLRKNEMKKKILLLILGGMFTIVACGPSNKEKDAKQNGASDSLSAANQFESNSTNKMFLTNSLKVILPNSNDVVSELNKLGEDTLTKMNLKDEFNYPVGFTAYFDNKDAFKENLAEAPGEILQLVSIDTVGKAVFFQPIKNAQARGLKLVAKVPLNANVTSVSYNIKSKSMIGFVLGSAQMETDQAYNFVFKEDLYCDIPDSSFNTTIINEVWSKATTDLEKSKLYIVKQAYVVSYITSKYKKKSFNVAATIPDQGGAVKIGSDVYVGSNNKEVIYKAKIIALPLKNFVTTASPANP
jgi:hypothetical protein